MDMGSVLIGFIGLNIVGYLYYDVLLPSLGTFIHLVY